MNIDRVDNTNFQGQLKIYGTPKTSKKSNFRTVCQNLSEYLEDKPVDLYIKKSKSGNYVFLSFTKGVPSGSKLSMVENNVAKVLNRAKELVSIRTKILKEEAEKQQIINNYLKRRQNVEKDSFFENVKNIVGEILAPLFM